MSTPTYRQGQDVVGCVIVRCPQLPGDAFILACPCQATFVIEPVKLIAADLLRADLKCPGCSATTLPADATIDQEVLATIAPRRFKEKSKGPYAPASARAVVLLRRGGSCAEVARQCSLAQSTVDKLYYRWIVTAELEELRKENVILRQRLSIPLRTSDAA